MTRASNRVWMASSHALVEQQQPSLADCAAHPQVVLEADRVEGVLREAWTRQGLQPRVLMRTSSLEAVRSLIGVGAAIAILPDFLYRPWTLDAQHIEARSLRDAAPTIDVGLVWRRGSKLREVVQEFVDIAREQARGGRMR